MLDLGKAVQEGMYKKRLTPADLAKILGCSKAMVYHYMHGQKITIKRLVELSEIFGMKPSRLVSLGEK